MCKGFYHYPEKCVWLSQCVYRFLVLQLCCWVKCWGQCRMDGWMDGWMDGGLGVLLILIFLSFWGPVAWIRYLGTDLMHRRNICISRVLILTFFRACDVEVASALSPHTLIALRSRLCLVFIVSDWLFPGTGLTWQHGENTTVCLPTDSITVLLSSICQDCVRYGVNMTLCVVYRFRLVPLNPALSDFTGKVCIKNI